jgi:hypothetical protein
MAQKQEWWGKGDALWGGETFTATKRNRELKIAKGDKFRIEKGRNNTITLVPSIDNNGTWKDSHSKKRPIKLKRFPGTRNRRAYSMMVRVAAGSQPMLLFLIERVNGSVAITNNAKNPDQNGGTASVER